MLPLLVFAAGCLIADSGWKGDASSPFSQEEMRRILDVAVDGGFTPFAVVMRREGNVTTAVGLLPRKRRLLQEVVDSILVVAIVATAAFLCWVLTQEGKRVDAKRRKWDNPKSASRERGEGTS